MYHKSPRERYMGWELHSARLMDDAAKANAIEQELKEFRQAKIDSDRAELNHQLAEAVEPTNIESRLFFLHEQAKSLDIKLTDPVIIEVFKNIE